MTLLANRHHNFFNDPLLLSPMELFNRFTTANMNELLNYPGRLADRASSVLERGELTEGPLSPNVYKLSDEGLRYEYLVPGFSDQTLKARSFTENGLEYILIEGTLQSDEEVEEVVRSTYRREIKMKKAIPSTMKVSNIELKNGILKVDLVKKPEEELQYIDWI